MREFLVLRGAEVDARQMKRFSGTEGMGGAEVDTVDCTLKKRQMNLEKRFYRSHPHVREMASDIIHMCEKRLVTSSTRADNGYVHVEPTGAKHVSITHQPKSCANMWQSMHV